ncbi:MAG TPA: phage holin family protein [Thermoanaerobaculia bacterium]|nr:phage holin family protein [Thermoanaerobaculia bacterium]
MAIETEARPSLGTLFKGLTSDLSTLVRSEVALAKLEVRQAIAGLGASSALLVAALFCGLLGLGFLFVTALLGLVALGVPAWLSSLIVTIVLFLIATVLGLSGKKKITTVQFLPAATIDNIKTDIDAIRSGIERAKETA